MAIRTHATQTNAANLVIEPATRWVARDILDDPYPALLAETHPLPPADSENPVRKSPKEEEARPRRADA
jgi:hypothetical protein